MAPRLTSTGKKAKTRHRAPTTEQTKLAKDSGFAFILYSDAYSDIARVFEHGRPGAAVDTAIADQAMSKAAYARLQAVLPETTMATLTTMTPTELSSWVDTGSQEYMNKARSELEKLVPKIWRSTAADDSTGLDSVNVMNLIMPYIFFNKYDLVIGKLRQAYETQQPLDDKARLVPSSTPEGDRYSFWLAPSQVVAALCWPDGSVPAADVKEASPAFCRRFLMSDQLMAVHAALHYGPKCIGSQGQIRPRAAGQRTKSQLSGITPHTTDTTIALTVILSHYLLFGERPWKDSNALFNYQIMYDKYLGLFAHDAVRQHVDDVVIPAWDRALHSAQPLKYQRERQAPAQVGVDPRFETLNDLLVQSMLPTS